MNSQRPASRNSSSWLPAARQMNASFSLRRLGVISRISRARSRLPGRGRLVSSGPGDVLGPLLDVLPQAADVGLHLVVARRNAGLARAMYDPVLAHLRDSGCMTLLMSGSPEEGAVIGTHRAVPQPPGRGLFVTCAGAQRVQVGWSPS